LSLLVPQPERTGRDQEIFAALNSVDGWGVPEELKTAVSLAQVEEQGLERFQDTDWRQYFSLKLAGRGLEIGALHRPLQRHDEMTVEYFDRYTTAELRENYPELRGLPLVEADVIGEAETLESVADAEYDFVVAAHVLEHMKNPILALQHWCRVLRPGGLLYLVVPDKRLTFDRLRLRTSIEHLILDYLEPSEERDREHYLDYAVWVNKKSGRAAVQEAERLRESDYSIHFHVFLPSDVVELLAWFSHHVHPIELVEGPSMGTTADEFHLLIRTAQ
jgi:SAM-dependent methyltransferase